MDEFIFSDLVSLASIAIGWLLGIISAVVATAWRTHRSNKMEARALYDEALAIAAENRDEAQHGCMLLYEFVQRAQQHPDRETLKPIRECFQAAAANIAEPNSEAAIAFYDSIYSHDGSMPLREARIVVKKARHFLNQNRSANRATERKLALVEFMSGLRSDIKPENYAPPHAD